MNWWLVVLAVVLAFVYAFVSMKAKQKQEKREQWMEKADVKNVKKKPQVGRKKVKVAIVQGDGPRVKLSDYESMTLGASQMADGGLLLMKGIFRLVAFICSMVYDVVKTGYQWVLKKERK